MIHPIIFLLALAWLLSGVFVAGYLAGVDERDTGEQEEGEVSL